MQVGSGISPPPPPPPPADSDSLAFIPSFLLGLWHFIWSPNSQYSCCDSVVNAQETI